MKTVAKKQLEKIISDQFGFYKLGSDTNRHAKGKVLYLTSKNLGVDIESHDFASGTQERAEIVKESLRLFYLLCKSLKADKGIFFRDKDAWLEEDMTANSKDEFVRKAIEFCKTQEIPVGFEGGLLCESLSSDPDAKYLISSSVDAEYHSGLLLYSDVPVVVVFPPCPLLYVFTDREGDVRNNLEPTLTEADMALIADPVSIEKLFRNKRLYRSEFL